MATQNGRELDREAKAHMALAVLLRKERAPAKREEIRRILQSNLSTARIVEAIKRLDADESNGAAAPPREPDETPPGPVPGEEPENGLARPGRASNPFRLTLPKLKSILKRPRVRAGFFRYLLRELPRITEFGRESHVFAPLLLRPVLRLERNIPSFFTESLVAWANELLGYLAPVLVTGWKHLTKKRFNILVALDRLCREITATNLRLFNLRDRKLIDKLRTLESLFLVFHYSPDTRDETVNALTEVMSKVPDLEHKCDRAALLVRRILESDFTIPSLQNLLLGLNMVKLRTAVSLNDLFTSDLGELFETECYACNPQVAEKIQSLVEELKINIAKLHREWSRLVRLGDLLNRDPDSERPNFPEMIQVYESASSTLNGRSFEEDRDNVMDLALNFFRRFEVCCSPLLSASVYVKGQGKVAVVASSTFQNELDRLRLTASKLERAAFGFRSFPYSRYLAIKREGKAGISAELQVIALLDEASSVLVSIATKLERVMNSSRASASDGGNTEQANRPIDSSAFQSRRKVVVPYRDSVIAKNPFLAGKTVREAIRATASVCLQSAVYFYEKPFVEALATEGAIHERMDRQLQTLRRIGDKDSYDKIVGVLLTTT